MIACAFACTVQLPRDTMPAAALRIALALALLPVLRTVPPLMVTEPPALSLTVSAVSVVFAEVMIVSAPEKAKTAPYHHMR